VLTDTGLGIGIDFGEVTIVRLQDDLTIVGTPVVYACRMGGAPAGTTLVNQPAYEIYMKNFSSVVNFSENELNFKNEGKMLAYEMTRNTKALEASTPDWVEREPETKG
jgi:class 3 adenylate cyclase